MPDRQVSPNQGQRPVGWLDGSFDAGSLGPAKHPSSMDVHLAAVEYALSNAIVMRDENDIMSNQHWSETLKPFAHQIRNLMTFCRRAPVALFADDVGLGKTISAGLVLSELMTRGKVRRALVVCPLILNSQWHDELKTKFGIRSVYESGSALRQHLDGPSPVVITTYQTASRYIDEIRESSFDMVILDEAHKLKSLYGANKPAQMAVNLHGALRDHVFKYVLMLTATPIQNSAWDLYSLIDALAVARYHDNPFGSVHEFANNFLRSDGRTRAIRNLHHLRSDKQMDFRRVLSEYMVRTSRGTANLPFPTRTIRDRSVEATTTEANMTAILKRHVEQLRPIETFSLALASMSSPKAFADQIENMARRPDRTWLSESVRTARKIADASPAGAKASALTGLIDELRSKRGEAFRAVVFTNRRATQEVLGDLLKAQGISVGYIRGGDDAGNQRTIRGFREDVPTVNVVVSTDAGALGVNLQVANVLVNYDLPWNPMVVEQRIGRVQRLGSTHRNVSIFNLVVADSLEEQVVARLIVKLQTITNALGDVEAILEAASGAGTNEVPLEQQLKELVRAALLEQPVDEALKAIERNIDTALAEYESEKQVVDETIGEDLDAMHAMGPKMPPLEAVVPRMDVRTFVRTAFELDRARITELDRDRLQVQLPGQQPFVATFDRNDPDLHRPGYLTGLAGANVRLYEQGSRPFEQLVGAWTQNKVHLTYDERRSSHDEIEAAITSWTEAYGGDVRPDRFDVLSRERSFGGRVAVRASVAVTHDRLERLIDVQVGGKLRKRDEHLPTFDEYVAPDDIHVDLETTVASAVTGHADLKRFAHFYRERGEEESKKRTSPERREAIQRNFEPMFAAQLEAAHGRIDETVALRAHLTIDGHGPYPVDLKVAAGNVVESPPEDTCHVTKRTVPASVLQRCAITGRVALPHRMVTSDLSGRRALPSEVTECAVTHRTLLSDEIAASDVSGLVVAASELVACSLTGTRALPDELVACDFTGDLVTQASLLVSTVSGRQGRRDQMVASAVSGAIGHESELERCGITREWVLPDELTTSTVSQKRVRKDQVVNVAKRAGMRAHRSEVVPCTLSGALLLPSDTQVSAVSGARADKDLMVRSDVSGKWAMPSETFVCAESGKTLLKHEGDRCNETHVRVDRALLARNDFTQSSMLSRLLETCPESGKRGRARDLRVCEATKVLVDPDLLVRCTATDQMVLRRLTVTCAECNRVLLESSAVRTHDQAYAHPTHAELCAWTKEHHRTSDMGRCAVTGLPIARREQDLSGRSKAFVRLEEVRWRGGGQVDRSTLDRIRVALSATGHRPASAWIERAPNPNVVAVLYEVRTMLGFRSELHRCFMDGRLGQVVAGEK